MVTTHLKAESRSWANFRTWRQELLFTVPIVALVVYLFYTWFAVLNRYLIFLYFHDMGPGFDTTPFGWVTVSRYWMSGLVAAGAVMVPYLGANLVLGRLVSAYRAPVWWRLWVLCAIPLSIVIPIMVMTVNDPVLPLPNALQVTVVLMAGLALAVALGQHAADHPLGFFLLMVDGMALACLLMALRAIEFFARWLARGNTGPIYRFLAVLTVGAGLLLLVTAVYCWLRRAEIPRAAWLLVAGLNIQYLFLPVYHYLFWCKDGGTWTDPDYFSYITDADNYFARSSLLQIGIWIALVLLAMGVTRLRVRLRHRRMVS
jgi:hypothetical protein